MRRFHANTTLIFLGSCLLFAEGALGVIAAVTDVSPTLLSIFALVALGMVLTALVMRRTGSRSAKTGDRGSEL